MRIRYEMERDHRLLGTRKAEEAAEEGEGEG
jgi:hypothetical protein